MHTLRASRRRGLTRTTRRAAAVAAAATLSMTASGCMTVHGEREVIPSLTKAEARVALKKFVSAYNASDAKYDPALDAAVVTGPLGAINQAGLRAKRTNYPDGNPNHTDLKLTDPQFIIPKMAGWPKFWAVEADSNRDRDDDPKLDNSWLLVFVRNSAGAAWQAAYLNVVTPGDMPRLTTDKEGLARAVKPGDASLTVAPKDLSKAYVSYLGKGGDDFAPGAQTTGWRETREKNASRPGRATQYVDQPLTDGPYAPVALRTEDGGALVFFTTHHYEKQTASKGLNLTISTDVKALMTGDAKQSVTLESVSNQVVVDPPRSAGSPQVRFLSRIEGLTGAKGE